MMRSFVISTLHPILIERLNLRKLFKRVMEEKRNGYKILVGTSREKKPLET
jgi:hypothetical protein